MKRACVVSLCVGLFAALLLTPATGASQGVAPPQAIPAVAQKSAEPVREVPADQKAYQDAIKIGDPDKKIDALKKLMTDFPKSAVLENAESQIFTTLVKKASDTIKAVQDQAKSMGAADTGAGRGANASIASALSANNLLLDEAETYALKAVSLLSDQQKFVDAQKKSFADRQAEALKKDPAAKADDAA